MGRVKGCPKGCKHPQLGCMNEAGYTSEIARTGYDSARAFAHFRSESRTRP